MSDVKAIQSKHVDERKVGTYVTPEDILAKGLGKYDKHNQPIESHFNNWNRFDRYAHH